MATAGRVNVRLPRQTMSRSASGGFRYKLVAWMVDTRAPAVPVGQAIVEQTQRKARPMRVALLMMVLLMLAAGCGVGRLAGPTLTAEQAQGKVVASLGQFGDDLVKPVGLRAEWAGDGVWRVSGRFRFELDRPEEEGMWLVDDRAGTVASADDAARRVEGMAFDYNRAVAELVCPEGYPVKANPDTMRYTTPEHPDYHRTETRRVRCYPNVATAEAQGYLPLPRYH